MLTLLAAASQPAYGGVMVSVARLRRFVLLVAALAALGALVPAAASANGCPLRISQGTSGTTADPIRIDTVADLNIVAANSTCFASAYAFQQTTDLTLTGTFTPIGSVYALPFNGTYDGAGHVINGLTVTRGSSSFAGTGLFGAVDSGTVKNLTIASARISATDSGNVGVLAGVLRGATTISNVHVTGTSTVSGAHSTGGLFGVGNSLSSGSTVASSSLTISGSSSTAVVTGQESVGGLAGFIQSAAINDSYARGSVTGTSYVGGLVGTAQDSTLVRSFATGRVVATSAGGGLVGSDFVPAATSATASFWDIGTSGQSTSLFGTGKSTAELQVIVTFSGAGWGIASGWQASTTTTPWGICSTVNDGYPFLLAEYATSPCPAAPAAAAAVVAPPCSSTGWSFGILDISKSGYGDRLQVTWKTPKTCDGSAITGYTLFQASSKAGAETAVDLTKCTPSGANSTGWGTEVSDAGVLHACSFPVKGPDERWFRLTAATSKGKTIQSRRIAWIRSDVPNADVQDFSGSNCSLGRRGMRPVINLTPIGDVNISSNLVCFIMNIVIQTEFASNGDQALTDKQMFELLSIGVSFADSETARSGRATRWISAGHRSYRVRRSGPAAIQVPLNAKAAARLRNGSLRVRYTISIKRGSVTKQIIKYATLPKVAATGVPSSVTG